MGDELAVHPGTGELLEQLDQQPPETLAEALAAVNATRADLDKWQRALEGELRRRLKALDRTFTVFGDWEVRAPVGRSRSWDAAELEGVLTGLAQEGVIKAAEAAGVIVREPKVAGKAALALRSRLTGDARAAVDDTWTWIERPDKLEVVRSVELPTADEVAEIRDRAGTTDPSPFGGSANAPDSAKTRPRPGAALAPLSEPPAPYPLDVEELFA